MRRRVVITGRGVLSALGATPGDLHAALCRGTSGLAPLELFPTEGPERPLAGEINGFAAECYLGPRNLRPLDRTSQLLASAAQLALDDGRCSAELRAREEVGLVVGTMFCSVRTIAEFDRRALTEGPCYASPMDFANTVINAAAGQTAIWHNLRGINSTVCSGSASGLHALAHAADLVRTGRVRAVLAGGVEELCFESLYGFTRAGWLQAAGKTAAPVPFSADRSGFALGEGAALLLLEDAEFAQARGAPVRAEVAGHGALFDWSRGAQADRARATAAGTMRLALADAGLAAAEVAAVSAAANGSVCGDRDEALALREVFRSAGPGFALTAIKALLGETLGAGGALQALDLLETMHDGTLPGVPGWHEADDAFLAGRLSAISRAADVPHGLVNAGGLDGRWCSLVLSRWEAR